MTTPAALALLVIVWPGHNMQQQTIDRAECETAMAAVRTAVHIREEQYAMQPDVSAYCVPVGTAADQAVHELLEPPKPSPEREPILVQPAPNH